jgi:hypothetical protein
MEVTPLLGIFIHFSGVFIYLCLILAVMRLSIFYLSLVMQVGDFLSLLFL